MIKKIPAMAAALTLCLGMGANAALIGPKTESTKFFTESFDYYEDGNPKWYMEGDAALYAEDNGNTVMRLEAKDTRAYTARTFRETSGDFVVDLSFMPEEVCEAQFILYSEGYYKFPFVTICEDGNILLGDTQIGKYITGEYNRITAIVSISAKTIDLTVNDTNSKLSYIPQYDQIAGIGFAADKGTLRIDNVRCYASSKILDDYDLMTDAEKVYDLLTGRVAVLIDCENAMSGRQVEMINPASDSVRTCLIAGNTMVPLRFISEKLGATVTWLDPEILIEKEGEPSIRFVVGSTDVSVDGVTKSLNVPPFVKDGTTFVPLRAFAETMGYKVHWHDTGIVIVGEEQLKFREPEKSEEMMVSILEVLTGDTYYYDTFGKLIRITEDINNIGREIITPIEATADSSDTNVPSNLIDGSLDTRWSASGTDGVSAYIDYGEVKDISKIALSWNNGTARNEYYEIYSSIDGENWTLEYEKRQSSGISTYHEILDMNCKARYIRYSGFGNSSNYWNSVTEIVAFGDLS